jgi:hypothetical protein
MGKTRTSAARSGACIQRVISGESFTGVCWAWRQRRKSARRRRRRAGGDGLLVALAGLAQMDVNVDQAGRDGEAGCVENLGARWPASACPAGNLGHAAVFEQNVLGSVHAAAGSIRWPPRITSAVMRGLLAYVRPRNQRRSTTAMRMATPFAPVRGSTDCGPSATPAVTSRPRMMGPGCMTMASGACAPAVAR